MKTFKPSASSTSEDSHVKLYFPEELYSGWISNSLVLMTSSLLFYHMTKASSLEMDPRWAGVFGMTLIVIAVIYEISSIIPYYQRSSSFIHDPDNQTFHPDQVKKEKSNQKLYLILGCILATIQLGIAYVIITGSFKSIKA